MNSGNNKKKEPWRIIVFIMAVAYILYMWVKKDIASIYMTMPPEQVVPMIATTVAVTLVKVAAITGGILLLKWLAGKIGKK